MPEQAPAARVGNFSEVALGYPPLQAIREALRCLQCKTPWCHARCPLGIDIKGFVGRLQVGDFPGAYAIIAASNCLPGVCGRVCPQEALCESACVLAKKGHPVAIGRLERFVADWRREHGRGRAAAVEEPAAGAPRAACIGSGPSSLAAAGCLAAAGVEVTVFEALPAPGGALVSGIPDFRLPREVVSGEIEALKIRGVKFRTNWAAGRAGTAQDLLAQGFGAVFLGLGGGQPARLDLPGADLLGVYSVRGFLACCHPDGAGGGSLNPSVAGQRVLVCGGDDAAVDAARSAIRLGAGTVTLAWPGRREEMPCRPEELRHAVEEGLLLACGHAPVEFLGDGQGRLLVARLRNMDPDGCGAQEIFAVGVDLAVLALDAGLGPVLLAAAPGLRLDGRGRVAVDPATGETSIPNVFAGGDVAAGPAPVVSAMGDGRRAAREIARRLLDKDPA